MIYNIFPMPLLPSVCGIVIVRLFTDVVYCDKVTAIQACLNLVELQDITKLTRSWDVILYWTVLSHPVKCDGAWSGCTAAPGLFTLLLWQALQHMFTQTNVEIATAMQLIRFHHLPEIPSTSPSSPIAILNIYRVQTHLVWSSLSLSWW